MPVTPSQQDDGPDGTVWTVMAAQVARSVGPGTRPADGSEPGPELFGPGCPSRRLLDTVTSRWGVLVLLALSRRTMRWGELHRFVAGVSEKMLAQTLRAFEADGLVHRESAGTVPPRVDYTLTPRGRRAAELVLPLVRWAGEETVARTVAAARS